MRILHLKGFKCSRFLNQSPVLFSLLALGLGSWAIAGARAIVKVNGTSSPVYFNDGDSFRVLEGKYTGTKGRLAGFNTLESHGPVHRWGTWSTKELYINAKMATRNAERGAWVCQSEGEKDIYGRTLFDCPSLRKDQIAKGLAHAMTVTAKGASPELLEVQAKAQRERRGMWAHGVPEFVLTSLHSIDEGGKKYAYNRVVSSTDGHSEKLRHQNIYQECDEICVDKVTVDPAVLRTCTKELKQNDAIQDLIAPYNDVRLEYLLTIWLKLHNVAAFIPHKDRKRVEVHLRKLEADGKLVAATRSIDSCMTYVPFKRRYGGNRAACLR
mgnify:CR=1 FL=1